MLRHLQRDQTAVSHRHHHQAIIVMVHFSEVQVAPSACLRSKQRLRWNLHGLVPLPILLCLQVLIHDDGVGDDEDVGLVHTHDIASWCCFIFSSDVPRTLSLQLKGKLRSSNVTLKIIKATNKKMTML